MWCMLKGSHPIPPVQCQSFSQDFFKIQKYLFSTTLCSDPIYSITLPQTAIFELSRREDPRPHPTGDLHSTTATPHFCQTFDWPTTYPLSLGEYGCVEGIGKGIWGGLEELKFIS